MLQPLQLQLIEAQKGALLLWCSCTCSCGCYLFALDLRSSVGLVWLPVVHVLPSPQKHNCSSRFGGGGCVSRVRRGAHGLLGHERRRERSVITPPSLFALQTEFVQTFEMGSPRGCVPPINPAITEKVPRHVAAVPLTITVDRDGLDALEFR